MTTAEQRAAFRKLIVSYDGGDENDWLAACTDAISLLSDENDTLRLALRMALDIADRRRPALFTEQWIGVTDPSPLYRDEAALVELRKKL